MERCPPEIHSEIFALACTDDGRTARTLSEVNTYIRAVAAPFYFSTLSVSGPEQARALLQLLDTPTHTTRPIHHLFLCDRVKTHASSDWFHRFRSRSEDGEALFHALDAAAVAFALLLPRLLAHAAPTLRSLIVLAYDPYRAARTVQLVLNRAYPELEELTLRGSAWEVDPPAPPPVCAEALFPKLQRMHLAATRTFPRVLRQVVAGTRGLVQPSLKPKAQEEHELGESDVPPLAPPSSITHVRLSGLSRDTRIAARLHAELHARALAPASVPNLTRRLAREPTIACVPVDWAPLLPQQLARVVVQPHRLPPATDCACCSGYFVTEEMTHVLKELSRAQREEDARKYIYLPPRAQGEVYAYEEARQDWIDRISGGDGCWAPVQPGLVDEEDAQGVEWDGEYSGF